MSAAELVGDLNRLGVGLAAKGEKLRYWPRSAVTPDLADRLRVHKSALLAILRTEASMPRQGETESNPRSAESECPTASERAP